ncbi:GLPGLI family protein [Flavobacterium sp.]|uniref:GLPGLI family protein n=1 Tax=Flavobacterium sp. TaxID=239 RepID=UPI00375087FF
MKYIYTFIIIFFSINTLISQELNGFIEYSLSINEDEALSKGELSGYFKEATENAKYINYILEFNKSEMNFYFKNPGIDGLNLNFSIAFSGVLGYYYKKTNTNTVLNVIDDLVLGKITLKKDVSVLWQLHNESKKIQDFTCFKATTKIKFNNGVGDFERELTAWYCPKIPYSYGPKGYGGLPGIILEFQERNIVIGAKKIVFNTDPKIKEPSSDKITTEEEYNKLLEKHFEEEK